jgi:hypothetical protein
METDTEGNFLQDEEIVLPVRENFNGTPDILVASNP